MIGLICFNCGLKLHSGDEKECRFCGVRFSSKCPVCGFPNPTAARFCVNCGSKLIKKDGQSSVENYDTLVEGRKNVAVIFADVSGFTALSEKMDPEEVREIINECFNYITIPVYELGGTIDKYIGDCVMILFGARYAHADDAKRAVTCALKMIDLIKEFSLNNLSSNGISLNLSIGINYGLVVTGGVGNYFDRDYTVMGDIVNTAQRLQSCAGEGMILVSESVYAETSTQFVYSEASEVLVRNRETPVKCYSPLSINTDYQYGEESTFTGRQKEMAQLNTIYNNSINEGLQAVTLTGEAGIGKTRFLKEFTSRLGNDVKKVWTDCGADFLNRPYSLISGILGSIMTINPYDSVIMKQHRLVSFLDYILESYSEDEIKRCCNFLGLVMGLDRDSDFQSILQSMNFDNVRREILKQLAMFFKNLFIKQKLVIVAEDIQWADMNSLELLYDLLPQLKKYKAIMIFSTRLDKPLLSSESQYRIKLEPFTPQESTYLACCLLECEQLDEELRNCVLESTNGNPLHINEFVLSLKKKESLKIVDGNASIDRKDIEVMPSSIRNLILSSLSSLEPSVISILQAASVIGREFSLGMVTYLMDYIIGEDEISGALQRLGIIQLKKVHTSARAVEKVYCFAHEIEREVIYEGILNKSKKQLHKKVGEYIELKQARDLENFYEMLAEHYQKSDMLKKSAGFYYLSALKQKDLFNLESAAAYFNKYLQLCGNLNVSGETERLIGTYKELGYIKYVTADYDSALDCLNEGLKYSAMQDDVFSIKLLIAEIYKDKGMFDEAGNIITEIESKIREDSSSYGQWLQLKCNILRIQGDPAAFTLIKKSEKALLKARDYRSLSEIMKHAGIIHFTKGDIKDALDYMKKSYKYAERNRSLDLMANVSGDMGIIYYSTGRLSEAQEFLNKSMDISKSISFQKGITAACINLGILYLDKGYFEEAKKLFTESHAISVEVGSRLYECITLINLGDIAYEEGRFDEAVDCYADSMELARAINAPVEEGINLLGLSKVYLKTGRHGEISGKLDQALKLFSDADEMVYIADYHLFKGISEVLDGNPDGALKHYEQAAVIADECKNDRRILKIMRHKAELLLTYGKLNDALKLMQDAFMIVGRVESEYDAAKCLYVLHKAQEEAGMLKEAEKTISAAREHIAKIDRCRWTDIIESCIQEQTCSK